MSTAASPHVLKRDHDTFQQLHQSVEEQDDSAELEAPCSVPADLLERIAAGAAADDSQESLPTPPVSSVEGHKREGSVARSETGSLSDAASVTPSRDTSPAVGVPVGSDGGAAGGRDGGGGGAGVGLGTQSALAPLTGQPPAKRAKLTFKEREMKRMNKEIRDKEKAEEKARKEAERQALAAEKVRKEVEKEAEKQRKDADRAEKKAAQEAEKAAKEEKRKQKEEEKKKKERSQMKLGNFFNIPTNPKPRASSIESNGRASMSPAPQPSALGATAADSLTKTPGKLPKTPYEKMFLDFFVQDGVTVAPMNRFERDEDGVRAVEATIDAYLFGNRSPGRQRTFDAASLFHMSSQPASRGRQFMPVREIMSESYAAGHSTKPVDVTTDSQKSHIKRTNDLLKKVPLKFLKFQEDVRPPYRGTYTSRPVRGMAKLARNPMRRDLPDTNYDYDSEAEWVEDEDAEDLKSEDEEEEADDDDEDMDKFLDDENDETAHSRRLVIQGDLEPVSTGLCWEDRKGRNSLVKMMPYRMEIIVDSSLKFIDPFSTAYWAPPVSRTTSMDPPRVPLKSTSSNISLGAAASPKPVKSFFTPASDLPPQSDSQQPNPAPPSQTGLKSKDPKDAKPKKMISDEDLPAFRQAVEGSDLSKIGLIEVLKKKFPGRPAAAIKGTLETVAVRVGQKEADKRWVLV